MHSRKKMLRNLKRGAFFEEATPKKDVEELEKGGPF